MLAYTSFDSSIFTALGSRFSQPPETIGKGLLLLAAASLIIPIFNPSAGVILTAFIVFEVCCGLYFPCFGTLRGKYMRESTRAAVMNFFRVPLNVMVVVVLLKVRTLHAHDEELFLFCDF